LKEEDPILYDGISGKVAHFKFHTAFLEQSTWRSSAGRAWSLCLRWLVEGRGAFTATTHALDG